MLSIDALFWLFFLLFWTMILSFYSIEEMACISCNKLRLEYAKAQGKKWAIWLDKLLEHPTRLFSTTLIGFNFALMMSSESARELYEALGHNPNLAPLIHVPFVVLFGELIPRFAARMYADHASRLGAPILYLSSRLLSPCITIIEKFFVLINRLTGIKKAPQSDQLLSREELQKLLQEHTQEPTDAITDSIQNIFSLKSKTASDIMQPITKNLTLSAKASIKETKAHLAAHQPPYLLITQENSKKILGVVFAKDLLQAKENKRIDEYIKPCNYIEGTKTALSLLFEIQRQNNFLVVLNNQGEPQGIITTSDLLSKVLGTVDFADSTMDLYLEKTFSGNTSIQSFNEIYQTSLPTNQGNTFAEIIEKVLGRNPSVGEVLVIGPITITIKKTSLFKAKEILITALLHR